MPKSIKKRKSGRKKGYKLVPLRPGKGEHNRSGAVIRLCRIMDWSAEANTEARWKRIVNRALNDAADPNCKGVDLTSARNFIVKLYPFKPEDLMWANNPDMSLQQVQARLTEARAALQQLRDTQAKIDGFNVIDVEPTIDNGNGLDSPLATDSPLTTPAENSSPPATTTSTTPLPTDND